MAAMNSYNGSIQAIQLAIGLSMGELAICPLKTEYSISLLIPVYRNRRINNIEIISMMITFFMI